MNKSHLTKFRSTRVVLLAALVAMLVVANSYNVANASSILKVGASCDYTSLQDAIDIAQVGDRLHVATQLFEENILIDKNLEIIGGFDSACLSQQATLSILDGDNLSSNSVVRIAPDVVVTLENMHIRGDESTLRNGRGLEIAQSSQVVLRNSEISHNQFAQGAGIYVDNAQLTIENSIIHNNEATLEGAGIFALNGAVVDLRNDVEVRNNLAERGAGIFADGGQLILDGARIFDNQANLDGAGLLVQNSVQVTLEGNSRVYRNEAYQDGAGLFCQDAQVTMIDGADFGGIVASDGNLAHRYGGGAFLDACTMTLDARDSTNVEVLRNRSYDMGAGIFAENLSQVHVLGDTAMIRYNKALDTLGNYRHGGGIYLQDQAQLIMDGGQITFNEALNGAGIYARDLGTVMDLRQVRINNNVAQQVGGAIYMRSQADMEMRRVRVEYNEAHDGSALYLDNSTANVVSSLFAHNIINGGDYVVRLWTNTTDAPGADLKLRFSTLADNLGMSQSIFGNKRSVLEGHGLIVAGNDGIQLDLTEGAANTAINSSIVQFAPVLGIDNLVGVDPQFVDLMDYHLQANSPAINLAGLVPTGLSLTAEDMRDLDGQLRTPQVEAGAMEVVRVGIDGWLVDGVQQCGFSTIAEAMDSAVDSDILFVSSDTYYEQFGTVNKDLTLASSVADCSTLNISATASSVIIDAQNQFAKELNEGGILRVAEDTQMMLRNITLRDARAERGGLVFVAPRAQVIFDNVDLVLGEASQFGGALFIDGALVEMRNDSRIVDSHTIVDGKGAGVALKDSSLDAGILRLFDDSRIGDQFVGNVSVSHAGGVYMDGGRLEMHDTSLIRSNQATLDGGGIYAINGAQVEMYNNAMLGYLFDGTGNIADRGAGIFLRDINTRLEMFGDSMVQYNTANLQGGGIFALDLSEVVIDHAVIRDNRALDLGGGIYMEGVDVFELRNGTRIDSNQADYGAGVALKGHSQLLLDQAVVSGNIANELGGGFYLVEDASLLAPTVMLRYEAQVEFNQAKQGAGLYIVDGLLDLQDSYIDRNIAQIDGGAIYNENGQVNIRAITAEVSISLNEAQIGDGGAIVDLSGEQLSLHAQDGFALRLDGNQAGDNGGALYINHLNSRLDVFGNVQLTNNEAFNHGGAIYQDGGEGWLDDHAVFGHPVIAGNRALNGNGGGVYLVNVFEDLSNANNAPYFDGVELRDNKAIVNHVDYGLGGAVFADNSVFKMSNVQVLDNIAGRFGAGLYLQNASQVDIAMNLPVSELGHGSTAACDPALLGFENYCTEFSGNMLKDYGVDRAGSAIYLRDGSQLVAKEVAFLDNHSEFESDLSPLYGSAIYAWSDSDVVRVVNSRFSQNLRDSVLHMVGNSILQLDNNTFADNFAVDTVRIEHASTSAIFNNNIFWNDVDMVALGSPIARVVTASSIVNSCNISQNGVAGVAQDPMFVVSPRGYYHLDRSSTALRSCNNYGLSLDLDKHLRLADVLIDMGAFDSNRDAVAPEITYQWVGDQLRFSWEGQTANVGYDILGHGIFRRHVPYQIVVDGVLQYQYDMDISQPGLYRVHAYTGINEAPSQLAAFTFEIQK